MTLTSLLLAGVAASAQVPRDQWREPPNTPLVTAERLATIAPKDRTAWEAYLRRSRALHDRDTAAMGRELRAAGKTLMTQAPYVHEFALADSMTPAWFAGDNARRTAEIILSFQAPNGGWSKHVDMAHHLRQPGESYFGESDRWEWISTIDNGSTTEEIRFLIRANTARRDQRYEAAIQRGVDYLTASQYPNGCFPQVFPLQGGYHDAVAFNDDATVNVVRLMREVSGGALPYLRAPSTAVLSNGVQCILDAQVRVNGVLTGWGQQHDPLTLEPTNARTYELRSLAAIETAAIVDFLMSMPNASAHIVTAVDAAVAWLESVSLRDCTYTNFVFRASPGAGPLWGRMYEIGTNRVIMANRDGVKLYDWEKLTDRRSGYRWYGDQPAATIAAHQKWKARRR